MKKFITLSIAIVASMPIIAQRNYYGDDVYYSDEAPIYPTTLNNYRGNSSLQFDRVINNVVKHENVLQNERVITDVYHKRTYEVRHHYIDDTNDVVDIINYNYHAPRVIERPFFTNKKKWQIFFHSGSSNIRNPYLGEIADFIEFARTYPNVKFKIYGFASHGYGSESYNMDLASRRINSFIDKVCRVEGIDYQRFSYTNYGCAAQPYKGKMLNQSIIVEIDE